MKRRALRGKGLLVVSGAIVGAAGCWDGTGSHGPEQTGSGGVEAVAPPVVIAPPTPPESVVANLMSPFELGEPPADPPLVQPEEDAGTDDSGTG